MGMKHKKARKKSFRIFLAWDYFLVIVHMLMNSKKARKLLLQFVPMFTTFWLKCPGLVPVRQVAVFYCSCRLLGIFKSKTKDSST